MLSNNNNQVRGFQKQLSNIFESIILYFITQNTDYQLLRLKPLKLNFRRRQLC